MRLVVILLLLVIALIPCMITVAYGESMLHGTPFLTTMQNIIVVVWDKCVDIIIGTILVAGVFFLFSGRYWLKTR